MGDIPHQCTPRIPTIYLSLYLVYRVIVLESFSINSDHALINLSSLASIFDHIHNSINGRERVEVS